MKRNWKGRPVKVAALFAIVLASLFTGTQVSAPLVRSLLEAVLPQDTE